MIPAAGGSGGTLQDLLNGPAFNEVGYENPPPDPRLNSILTRGAQSGFPQLRQGLMQQSAAWYKATGQNGNGDLATVMAAQPYPFRLNFNYNPSDITVTYALDPNITMPSQLTPSQLAATMIMPGQTQYAFNLLFDRAYECWDGGQLGLSNIRDYGVYIDIAFFERVTGVTVSDGNGGATRQNMIPVPVVVLSGGGTETTAGDPSSMTPYLGLGFVGYVTSATVTYTHFTSRMIPVRCSLSVTMQEMIGVSVSQALTQGSTNFSFGAYYSGTSGYEFSTDPRITASSSTSSSGNGN